MNREDDPEARIRELERPLTNQAQASELGGVAQSGDTAYLPPPVPGYTPTDYSTPAYGNPPPYGTQTYGSPPYGSQFPNPPRKSSGGMPWVVLGVVALVFIGAVVGVIVYAANMMTTNTDSSNGGGKINVPSIPSIDIPSFPAIPSAPTEPTEMVGAPGQTLSVSGVEKTKTITCNDATVTVSGVRNTVKISGHCGMVQVSGMNNVITVDTADTLSASGLDNRITYHSGSPEIDTMGSNTVEQG